MSEFFFRFRGHGKEGQAGIPDLAGAKRLASRREELSDSLRRMVVVLAHRCPPIFGFLHRLAVGRWWAVLRLENFCNFAAPAGVLGSNDETPVQTPSSGLIPPADFTTFMRAYQDMVFSTAARITGNETQAEDISQEVFLKAHAHFDNLRTSPTAGGWLKTVATNLSLNHLTRYRNRWKFFSELKRDDAESDAPEVEFAAPDTFFSGVDADERRDWVERALEDLPHHQRVPLVLYHFEDLPYDEIAKKLGVSLAKVKTDILRARTALAKILQRGGTAHETLET